MLFGVLGFLAADWAVVCLVYFLFWFVLSYIDSETLYLNLILSFDGS